MLVHIINLSFIQCQSYHFSNIEKEAVSFESLKYNNLKYYNERDTSVKDELKWKPQKIL